MDEKIFRDLLTVKKTYDEAVYAYDHCPRESAATDMMLTNDLRAASGRYRQQLEAVIAALTKELNGIADV